MLRSLREAFGRDGADGLCAAHEKLLRGSLRYRAICALAGLVVPVTPVMAAVKELDGLIGERGACAASREILSRASVPWQVEMPEHGPRDILSSPIVFYGKHGSALTPLLLAAALDRPDLKMVASEPIAKIGPNIEQRSFLVYTVPRAKSEGVPSRGAARTLSRMVPSASGAIDRDEARAYNRASLVRATDHVRRGGGLLIAPDPRRRKSPWRQGIGVVVVGLAHDPGPHPVYVVPWSITRVPLVSVLQLLSPNPLSRALARVRLRRPIRVAFGEPMAVRRIVELAGYNPAKVAGHLERDYRERNL